MICIFEVWEKGKLVSRKETDDGILNLQVLDARLKTIETKVIVVAVI